MNHAKYMREWRKKNRDKVRGYERKRYHARPDWAKNRWLKQMYGITLEQFNEMLEQQDKKCAICGATEPGGRHNTWHVDHNHTTQKVRSLLCYACNLTLGHAKEDVCRLRSCIEYLKQHAEEDGLDGAGC